MNTFARMSVDTLRLVERLQFVCLNWSFVLVQVSQWILSTIVVRIVIRVNCLRLQSCDSVKFLDCCCPQTCQGSEHGALDFCDLSVLDSVYQCVLSFSSVVLQFFRSIFLSKRSNFVEIHLQVVRHFFGEVIFWRTTTGTACHLQETGCSSAVRNVSIA